ncbi:enoyl-CoA hydratase/isomerase family protein [Streptomyces megasporus]|uniref:enoyl-CoA hydratase/isomerase family protein n=1 Tax=Streptomyces megasporus TaxID=44060 RepID=UPI000997265E|nr:enoyl-CoA hydratase-related protein [Streptomyces megasporus]
MTAPAYDTETAETAPAPDVGAVTSGGRPDPGARGRFAAFADRVSADPAVPLLASLHEGVAVLRLDRPERRNALTLPLSGALLEGLVRAGADHRVRAVVLRGSGPAFCAGDDVPSVRRWLDGDRADVPFDPVTSDAHYLRICEQMLHLPKPVVVGLTGATAGAGAEIACAADYRLADDTAAIGSRLASVGHVGNVVLMSRLVGPARATEIYLTGRMVPAAEALSLGLVDRVVPAASFEAELAETARRFAALPTRSVGLFKELRERSWGQPAEYGLRLQDAYHLRTHDEVRDAAEGLDAFVARRPPRFEGR